MSRFLAKTFFGATLAVCAMSEVAAQSPEAGNLVFGLGQSDGTVSIELVGGPLTEGGGTILPSSWDEPFVQSIAFDNLGSISHNPQGNLLGATFGREPLESPDGTRGGTIHSLATCSAVSTDQNIGDTIGLGGTGLTETRIGGLSISPDNSKIAVTGYDSGSIVVYDYTPGDCNGSGAALSNGRETPASTLPQFSTQGTTWLDDNTVIGFARTGDIILVDATTMDASVVTQVVTANDGSQFTSAIHNPAVTPLLYLAYGTFDGTATSNTLYILDPTEGDIVQLAEVDLSESVNTFREIALDAEGNLYFSQFGGTVDVLLNADDPDSLTDNSTFDWYTSEQSPSFSGLDVAVGVTLNQPATPDFSGDGAFNTMDLDLLFDEIDAGNNDASFDLTSDGSVDVDDVSDWLSQVGTVKGYSDTILPGDIDLNGIVDAADLNVVGLNWQSTTPAGWSQGDFNNDEIVDASDLNDLALNWRSDITGLAAAVPEPSGLSLLLTATIAIWGLARSSE